MKVTALIPVIMCGGAGTRLWPASRESMPKQFIDLLASGRSSFQAAIERVGNAPDSFLKPVVIANTDARFVVAEQLAQVGMCADIVLEPQRRDSAAAVAVCVAAQHNPEAVVLILAADHQIGDPDLFVASCRAAAEVAAAHGTIMTLGIVPRFPSTFYGYIKPGAPIPGTTTALGEVARSVERFVEKPDEATATAYIGEGYLWNSGNFLFRANVMLDELEHHAPLVLAAARRAVASAVIDLDFVRLNEHAFKLAPKTSIDYAVMERTARAGVLPVTFSWSDVGDWGALWEVSSRDGGGNSLRGNVEVMDCRNSLVQADDAVLTTVVGLDDVVVVAEPDAVLVTSRARAGEVKDLVARLRTKGRREADEHLRLYRPWGWYQRIDLGGRFQVKRILVHPGGRLSLQKHFHRAEHWGVVRGTAEVTLNGAVQMMHENEAAYIPIGSVHRLANPGRIPLELIEVQVGSYTGEDDIVRMEDMYGR